MNYKRQYDRYVQGEYPEHECCLPVTVVVLCLLLLLGALVLPGCRSMKVVPVAQVQRVEMHDTVHQTDTLWRDRTRYVLVKGDTVWIRDSVYVYGVRWRDRVKETVRIDSIPYPVEVEKPVEVRSGWDRFCTWWTVGSWVVIALLMVIGIVRLVK